MSNSVVFDLCVIGAGSGGLSVAAGAAQMGASVVLIEKAKMGGDCLNTGCVPSKALLAAGRAAESARRADRFGIKTGKVGANGKKVFAHVEDVIARIAPHDSVERFESLGVTVIQGAARFTAPDTVEAAGESVVARKFVIATGSSPRIPAIDGLDDLNLLTNENIFDLKEIPDHLIVIGGGPIGCEMAQAFRHLGAEVTLLEMAKILPNDDPELVGTVRMRLLEDGVVIHEDAQVVRTSGTAQAPEVVVVDEDGREHLIQGTHLLVAAGRQPNVMGLGLEHAGVNFTPKGIEVDTRLRTSNKRIFAIGDVAGGLQFTHVASHHAGVVIRNVLFKWPSRTKLDHVPWVTYTDPELAQAGLTEAQARTRFGARVKVLTWPFADNDRAQAERETEGLIKVVLSSRGKILGAGICGPHAGDLIQPWVLAMEQGLKIGAMASTIAPYPTFGEISKRAAGGYFTAFLYGPRMRKIVGVLQKCF
ncbi:dihydrolipoyl dehydrogenase family protein [Magnetovibrio sp.]|uniref:dihydrolipoyl dehydrogenase family protein n=1 Tax=Magnetovibrio sp. TaxID=2024836 RepID=UPI002F92F187